MKQTADNQRVFRVNFKAYLARLGAGRFILAAIIIAVYFFAQPAQGIFVLAGVVLGLGVAFYHLTQRRVIIGDTAVIAVGGLAKKQTITRASLEAHYFTRFSETNFGIFERILLRDAQTGARISINGLYWDAKELAEIRKLLQQKNTIATHSDIVASADLAKQYPQYLSYIERHPYKSASLIVLAVVVAAIAFAAIMYTS